MERRARRGLFTVSIVGAGGEHKLQSVTGLEQAVTLIDPVSESTRLDSIVLPAQFNMGDVTIREAPFAGCGGQPATNFLFDVFLNGIPIAHMRSFTGLGIHWDIMENHESTSLNTQKLWNKRSVPEITLNQVIDWGENDPFYYEMRKMGVYQGPGNGFSVVGGATCAYRGDWTIILKQRNGAEVARWTIYGAFPSRYTPIPDLEATATDVGMRSLTLRSSPAYAIKNIEERVASWPARNQIVSRKFLRWVSSIFDLPTRRDLVINMYHPGSMPGVDAPEKRYKLFNCWVSQLNYQDLDASSPAMCTREIVIANDGFVVT